jgi:hypothetical protein
VKETCEHKIYASPSNHSKSSGLYPQLLQALAVAVEACQKSMSLAPNNPLLNSSAMVAGVKDRLLSLWKSVGATPAEKGCDAIDSSGKICRA